MFHTFPRVNKAVLDLKESRGWTMRQTAEALGISASTLYDHLHDRTKWRVPQLAILCDLTGMDADYLAAECHAVE